MFLRCFEWFKDVDFEVFLMVFRCFWMVFTCLICRYLG